MMKKLNRQGGMLLWMITMFVLCPKQVESIFGVVKERNNILKGSEHLPYKLRKGNEHQDCVDDLFASDLNADSKLSEEEYAIFIAVRSRGGIEGKFNTLPFSLISNFIFGSCFCSFLSQTPNCCVGTDAGINLDPNTSPFIEDNLITICRTTDRAITDEIGTLPPTLSPIFDTERPSVSPTNPITEEPSGGPTFMTEEPSGGPTFMTEEPSGGPTSMTEQPSGGPTSDTSSIPTSTTTSDPTTSEPITFEPSSAPTITVTAPKDPICVTFQYGVENDDGFTADDIMNGFNNTYIDDLTIATRDTAIQILNETLPLDRERRALRQEPKSEHTKPYFGVVSLKKYELDVITVGSIEETEESMSGRRQAIHVPSSIERQTKPNSENRRLAFYTDSNPPVILDVIDNNFCPESDEGINCAIVDTMVCVFLEVGDNEEEFKDKFLEGFRMAFKNGSFQNAIPTDDDSF